VIPANPKRAALASTVFEMAADLDAAEALGHRLPISAVALREHYRNLARTRGVEHALQDAQRRYARQIECELFALDDSGAVVHREGAP